MLKKIIPFLFLLIISCSKKDDPIIKSSAKSILSFSLNSVSPNITVTIDENTKTIVANLPIGTNLTQLVPTIIISPLATISPNTNIAQDFTNPVTYTVKAEDGSTSIYTAKITRTKSSSKSLKSFIFNDLSPAVSATLDSTKYTISAIVPNGTDLTKLVPTITTSTLATIIPATGVSQDFTKPVAYTISAEDGGKQVWVVTVNLAQDIVLIPDKNFEKALISLGIDNIQDGKLLRSQAEKTTQLNLYDAQISNLQGIEAFINLLDLNCSYNDLTSLNISQNKALKFLDCSRNGTIGALNVSKNTALERLICGSNPLFSLDVSKNIALTQLQCFDNKLTNLDVSQNVNLTMLNAWGNNLNNLDVSKNLSLQYLSCNQDQIGITNRIKNLDISKNIALKEIDCGACGISILDFSKNINLQKVNCVRNSLKTLDFSKNLALQSLTCYECPFLTVLDISKNIALISLSLSGDNLLNTLDISKCIYLTNLTCAYCDISTLDVSKNIALIELNCSNTKIINLDVSKNTVLSSLDCRSNKIQNICVSSLNQPKSGWYKDATATYTVCK